MSNLTVLKPNFTMASSSAVLQRDSSRFSKHGKKWVVENQASNNAVVIDKPEMNEVVFIFNCKDTSVRINGKVALITAESCKNCQIVFDSVVSAVEVINCIRIELQVLNTCSTVRVDNTDSCKIYLSNDSLNCEMITSRSTFVNVWVPQENGDTLEIPIPIQYKSVILPNRKEIQTTAMKDTPKF